MLKNFITRPETVADAPTSVALIDRCVDRIGGGRRFTVDQYRRLSETPDFDLENDTQVVETSAGEMVGLAFVWLLPPNIHCLSTVHVHPTYEGQGIGTHLTHWAETRARELMTRAPAGAQYSLFADALSTHQPARTLLEAEGYHPARYFSEMRVDFTASPPEPIWPGGITLRTMQAGVDEKAIYLANEEIFQDHWGNAPIEDIEAGFQRWLNWQQSKPGFDPTLWFMALDGAEIAGISLCWKDRKSAPDAGWVNVLGVRRRWRRRGLALALLQHSFAELYRRGRRAVGLNVDSANPTGAMRLYEKGGMRVVKQRVAYEKVLRAGVDLTATA